MDQTHVFRYVTYVADSGAAARDSRLRVGDRLVEVNGVNTLAVSHAEAVDALKQNSTGVQMLIMRLPEHEEEVLDIAFEIGAGGLGFTIYGGADQVGWLNVLLCCDCDCDCAVVL